MELTVDNIVEMNRTILRQQLQNQPTNHEKISADREAIKEILNEANERETVFDQAAYILAAIPWAQPFSGGNKRTAFASAKILLANKNYSVEVTSKQDIEFLRKLLFEIQGERSQLNPSILAKITLYLRNRSERT